MYSRHTQLAARSMGHGYMSTFLLQEFQKLHWGQGQQLHCIVNNKATRQEDYIIITAVSKYSKIKVKPLLNPFLEKSVEMT